MYSYDIALISGALVYMKVNRESAFATRRLTPPPCFGPQRAFTMSDYEVELVVAFCKIGAVFGGLPPSHAPSKNNGSLLLCFCLSGTFLGGGLMQKYGRRPAIASCSVLFVLGPLIMALSGSVTGLCLGRFITGLGIGAATALEPHLNPI